jgi:hypothetical protein
MQCRLPRAQLRHTYASKFIPAWPGVRDGNAYTDSIFQLLLKNYFRVNLKIEQKRYFCSFLYTVAGNFIYSCTMIYVFPLFSVYITIFCDIVFSLLFYTVIGKSME